MHVLLVEDDEATRFLVERALRAWDHLRITTAADGEDAVRILHAQPVDVILSDYRMPRKNGVEVLCHAQQVQPHARRILMSGTLDEDLLRLKGAAACADFMFEKPDTREAWRSLLGIALSVGSSPEEARGA